MHRLCRAWAAGGGPWVRLRLRRQSVSVAAPGQWGAAPRDVRRGSNSSWPRVGVRGRPAAPAAAVCDQPSHPQSAAQQCVHAKNKLNI